MSPRSGIHQAARSASGAIASLSRVHRISRSADWGPRRHCCRLPCWQSWGGRRQSIRTPGKRLTSHLNVGKPARMRMPRAERTQPEPGRVLRLIRWRGAVKGHPRGTWSRGEQGGNRLPDLLPRQVRMMICRPAVAIRVPCLFGVSGLPLYTLRVRWPPEPTGSRGQRSFFSWLPEDSQVAP